MTRAKHVTKPWLPNLISCRDASIGCLVSRRSIPSSASIAAGLWCPGFLLVEDAAMTSAPEVSQCWCCGREFDEHHLVRLGAHREAAVCLGCVRDLQLRADEKRDRLNPSLAGRLRSAVRRTRDWVVGRGWHNRPVVGWLLRRLDRMLP